LDQQDLKLSKKLISSYKKRLEKEILDRSMKLRMPQNKFEEIINNNNELLNLKKALEELEMEDLQKYGQNILLLQMDGLLRFH